MKVVGLGDGPAKLDKYCLPKLTKETKAQTNEELKGILKLKCPKCFDSKLICEARQGVTSCKDWHFAKDDIFTSLSFYGSKTPFEQPLAQHIVWFMRYIADEGLSPLTWNIYTSVVDEVPLQFEGDFSDFIAFYSFNSANPYSAEACKFLESPDLVAECLEYVAANSDKSIRNCGPRVRPPTPSFFAKWLRSPSSLRRAPASHLGALGAAGGVVLAVGVAGFLMFKLSAQKAGVTLI